MDGFKNSTKTEYYKGGETSPARGSSSTVKKAGGGAVTPLAGVPASAPANLSPQAQAMMSSARSKVSSVNSGAPKSGTPAPRGGSADNIRNAFNMFARAKPLKKGGSVKGAAKISKVMGEFKSGTLHSGSKKGPEVTNPKQAVAIALSEARKAGAKIPVKKNTGGRMSESTSSRPVDRYGRPISDEMLNTPERIQRQSGQADPYEKMPKTGPAAPKRRPLGRGAAGDVAMPRDPRVPLIKRSHGGLAVMPKKK